jgi:hypothetical protein
MMKVKGVYYREALLGLSSRRIRLLTWLQKAQIELVAEPKPRLRG